jgi:hypothetical protein
MKIFRASFFKCRLSQFRWYRAWYGGRWERHFIDVCLAFIWLDMRPDRCWPNYRQPCSMGRPTVEDYPRHDA